MKLSEVLNVTVLKDLSRREAILKCFITLNKYLVRTSFILFLWIE